MAELDDCSPSGPRTPCAAPEALPLVDAAFVRSGGPEATYLRTEICSTCPVWEPCLALGMAGEWGVWGGTGVHERTRAGMPKPPTGSARRRLANV